jgi:putative transcriptional regulator
MPLLGNAPASQPSQEITMQSKTPLTFLVALILAALAVVSWRPAGAQDSTQPVLLVANPLLAEMYAHTVLIAIPMGDNRHAGLIINRPTERSLASLFPEHEPSKQVLSPVFFGGPVMTNSLFAVVRSEDTPGEGSLPFVPGLFLVAHAKTIDEIIERQPNDARYYVGFVAWKPGELDEELKKGFWYVMPPEADLLFRDTTNGLWEELVRRAGAAKVRAALPPGPRG